MTVSHPNQLQEIMGRMTTPVYWVSDRACGTDHQAWALMLSDGVSGERINMSDTLFVRLSWAFKWLEDNSMPIDGVDIVVQPKLK